jgi:gamma-glutamyltranspeptidase/glutathione hydrolase
MVVARHPLSAQAGCAMLAAGGNAVDAAVAASFAGSVVQPVANTIGGGGVLVLHDPATGSFSIDYLYRAPLRATADMYALEADAAPGLFGWSGVRDQANEIGHRAVATPGSVAGLVRAVEQFGQLSLSDVLAPAIELAHRGFEMDWYGSLMLGSHLDLLTRFPVTARTFLREGRFPYRPLMIGVGDIHRQPELAQTLQDVAKHGARGFYEGRAAEALTREMAVGGGLITAEDLRSYAPGQASTQEIRYRGYRVLGSPGNWVLYTQFFQMLGQFDLAGLAVDEPQRLHLLIEVMRRGWADRATYYGDPSFVAAPWQGLASPEYARALAGTIDPRRRSEPTHRPDPARFQAELTPPAGVVTAASAPEGRTVHISAMDGAGRIASLTETILGNYGSGVTTEGGVLLNNGMMAFSPVPGHQNSIAPGKRPSSNISPLILLTADGHPFLAIGASGGRKIMGALLQIVSLVIDRGLGIQEAIAQPRVDLEGDAVVLDGRFPDTTARGLEAMGHRVVRRVEDLSTFEFGNPCGILRDASGVLHGGVNPYQMTTAVGV